jgi:hypothetical protein
LYQYVDQSPPREDRVRVGRVDVRRRVARPGPGAASPIPSILREMGEDRQEHERADRDRERSEEAHWQAAEAGAEDEERPPDAPDRPEDDSLED